MVLDNGTCGRCSKGVSQASRLDTRGWTDGEILMAWEGLQNPNRRVAGIEKEMDKDVLYHRVEAREQ